MRGAPRVASVWPSDGAWTRSASLARPVVVQRLKTRSQFQAVLAGARVAATAHFVLHRCALDGPVGRVADGPQASGPHPRLFSQDAVWLGAMVPKRWAKRAVTRNTIKRQIYSVSSEIASSLPCAAHVVRLRAGFDRAHFVSAASDALKRSVRQELMQLFAAAGRTAPASGSGPARP